MREIAVGAVAEALRELCIRANYVLSEDMRAALRAGYEKESLPLARDLFQKMEENYLYAEEKSIAICQDTGMAVVFAEVGQDVHFTGGLLEDAVNEGVRRGYADGYLRKSVVSDPLGRVNTNDNTPAVLHLSLVAGESVRLTVAPKGFGSENMSAIRMFTPSAAREDIVSFVADTVEHAGGNPCPPIVVGVGIGGTFEKAALLSKQALLRETGKPSDSEEYAALERDMLEAVNRTGVGPQGFGGSVTALAVHIERYPTHIAGLPVAVNIGCHVNRHASLVL